LSARNSNERSETSGADRRHPLTWAQRLKRVFAIDIEVCRRCSGRLRVIASIENPEVIQRILEHLGCDGGSVDPAHPGQGKRRRHQRRAPPEVDGLI
jgi:hypothetical protein